MCVSLNSSCIYSVSILIFKHMQIVVVHSHKLKTSGLNDQMLLKRSHLAREKNNTFFILIVWPEFQI